MAMPTGVLVDLAMDLADAVVPPPDKREIRLAYLEAIESLVALGLTGMHDAGIDIKEAEVLIAMADDGELDMRVYAMLSDAGENLDAMGRPLMAHGRDHLEVRAVKLYADGALGSRGAALLGPYCG